MIRCQSGRGMAATSATYRAREAPEPPVKEEDPHGAEHEGRQKPRAKEDVEVPRTCALSQGQEHERQQSSAHHEGAKARSFHRRLRDLRAKLQRLDGGLR